jgi:hypothetical protein
MASSTLCDLDELELPFPGAEGEWVYTEDFYGSKSFGHFECPRCTKAWASAHAWKAYKQACKKCNTFARPWCLWENDVREFSREKKNVQERTSRPHDAARCEACKEGVCMDALMGSMSGMFV